MKKTALIFGINGQDGAYLAKKLIEKKYSVYGISRRKNYINLVKLNIIKKIKLFNYSNFSDIRIKKLLKKKLQRNLFFSRPIKCKGFIFKKNFNL